MYLLYLDDAGAVKKPDEKYFILAGIAVFERQTHWLQNELDEFTQTLGYSDPRQIELHGNVIRAGRGWWRRIPPKQRRDIIRTALRLPHNLRGDWRLFGVAVDKRAISPRDPVEYAFEQLCNRFDLFLRRLYYQRNPQRGLIILDNAGSVQQEMRLQSLATEFKTIGHTWGVTRNLADVPLFVDSRATRLIQYADLVAYAMWRKFEKGDDEFFNAIADDFDSEGGVVHGLHHYYSQNDFCDCPVCA